MTCVIRATGPDGLVSPERKTLEKTGTVRDDTEEALFFASRIGPEMKDGPGAVGLMPIRSGAVVGQFRN